MRLNPDPFSKAPPLHFYVLQAVSFLYMFFILASRDFSVYGFLPDGAFTYPPRFIYTFWRPPLLHWTTFQFIYSFLAHPSAGVIGGIQGGGIGLCLLGLLGIAPRWMAALLFIIYAHLEGLIMASNAEISGGPLPSCTMLILALTPQNTFYRFGRPARWQARSAEYQWPIFVYLLVMGSFYSLSGLNKLLDVGPHWPFVLHLEHLAQTCIERSLFVYSRLSYAPLCAKMTSPIASVLSGFITLVGEFCFLSVLFLPRLRPFFVFNMIVMHTLVYLTAGINFLGSSVLLLVCLDWNVLARRVLVRYMGNSKRIIAFLQIASRLDWFNLIALEVRKESQTGELRSSLKVTDENGASFVGAGALKQLSLRCPLLLPLWLPFTVGEIAQRTRSLLAGSHSVSRDQRSGKVAETISPQPSR